MDASRSDLDYVAQVFTAVIEAGATTVNFPDTVGYAIPEEFGAKIKYLVEHIPNIHKAIISVHCHNDLGLAVANTLAAISQRRPPGGGDHQRHRRTGRQRLPGRGGHGPGHPQGPAEHYYTDIVTQYIYPTSRLMSKLYRRGGAAQQGHRGGQRLCP